MCVGGMDFSPKSVLITGTNRGIGLELVKQFVKKLNPPQNIFATVRSVNKAQELNSVQTEATSKGIHLHVIPLELTDYSSYEATVQQIAEHLDGHGLNLVIHNGGVCKREGGKFGEVTHEHMLWEFENNAVQVLMLSQALAPLLRKAARASSDTGMSCSKAAFIGVTSNRSSLQDPGGGRYPYRASKVALNMIMRTMSEDLKADGVLCAVIHPGHLNTDMGGALAQLPVQEGVAGMMGVMATLREEQTGSFHDHKGDTFPW